jgi:hypothetical protein
MVKQKSVCCKMAALGLTACTNMQSICTNITRDKAIEERGMTRTKRPKKMKKMKKILTAAALGKTIGVHLTPPVVLANRKISEYFGQAISGTETPSGCIFLLSASSLPACGLAFIPVFFLALFFASTLLSSRMRISICPAVLGSRNEGKQRWRKRRARPSSRPTLFPFPAPAVFSQRLKPDRVGPAGLA